MKKYELKTYLLDSKDFEEKTNLSLEELVDVVKKVENRLLAEGAIDLKFQYTPPGVSISYVAKLDPSGGYVKNLLTNRPDLLWTCQFTYKKLKTREQVKKDVLSLLNTTKDKELLTYFACMKIKEQCKSLDLLEKKYGHMSSEELRTTLLDKLGMSSVSLDFAYNPHELLKQAVSLKEVSNLTEENIDAEIDRILNEEETNE